jgi:hypothetical protein
MRRLIIVIAVASACGLLSSCGGDKPPAPTTGASGTATSSVPAPPPPPVAVGALSGLLLSAADINAALGTTGMTVQGTYNNQLGNNAGIVSDQACVAVLYPEEITAYTGSGWIAASGQYVRQPGDYWTHYADQDVVAFPAASGAQAFFTASEQSWSKCANRGFTIQLQGQSPSSWAVGAVSNTDKMLRVERFQEGGGGHGCVRALTVRNNVVIDVMTCSNPPDDGAVKIADQIAAKVAAQ